MSINPNRDISVLWVAESNWVTGGGINPHEHDYYHMFIMRSGKLEFRVGDQFYQPEHGDAILALPGITHGLANHSESIGRVYEIKFTTRSSGLKNLLTGLPSLLPSSAFADALVQELVAEGGRREVSTPTFVSDYLLSLINFYGRHYGTMTSHEASTIDTTGYSAVSVEIVKYLEENYAREIPLQEIADAVGFNKNYICSVFKRDSGMTIGNCQTAIRIRKAAEMISFSDLNLAQVASATGFINLSHFNRIFKKVVGIPPGQYRRMFTADMLVSNGNEETLREVMTQNGFIVSVLGRKRLSIAEIVAFTDDEKKTADTHN